MIKHTQAIRKQLPTNCLSVFDHSMELAPKGFMEALVLEADYIKGSLSHLTGTGYFEEISLK